MDPEVRLSARCILAAPALPPFVGHHDQYRMMAGEFVKGEPFFLKEFGPVYVDGSVVDPTLPLARAAFAAPQIFEGKIVRSAVGTVSPDLPQTSDVAEHLATVMVTQLAAAGGEDIRHFIISDCASAVRSFSIGGRLADHHASPHAGFLRDVKRACIDEVVKVKAHLTREQAEARGEGHMWEGNFHVDVLAKDAAKAYGVSQLDANVFKNHEQRETLLLRTAAVLLAEWPAPPLAIKELERARRPGRQGEPQEPRRRHRFEWLQHLRRWRCAECGLLKRSASSVVDRSVCVGARWSALGFHAPLSFSQLGLPGRHRSW